MPKHWPRETTSPLRYVPNVWSARAWSRTWPKCARGLSSACLITCLQACTTNPLPAPPKVIVQLPPAALLSDTPVPTFEGATNGDLWDYQDVLKAALGACNADKAAVRGWAERASAQESE